MWKNISKILSSVQEMDQRQDTGCNNIACCVARAPKFFWLLGVIKFLAYLSNDKIALGLLIATLVTVSSRLIT